MDRAKRRKVLAVAVVGYWMLTTVVEMNVVPKAVRRVVRHERFRAAIEIETAWILMPDLRASLVAKVGVVALLASMNLPPRRRPWQRKKRGGANLVRRLVGVVQGGLQRCNI